MEISVRGWGRDHGSKLVAKKDLMEAKTGPVDGYVYSSTYIAIESDVVRHPSGPRIVNERVEVRFGGKMNLNGDYQIKVAHDKREIARLFFLLNPEVRDLFKEAIIKGYTGIDPRLLEKVSDLELSVRTSDALAYDNVIWVGELLKKTEPELLRLPNFGRKSLNEIKEALSERGLRLGTPVPWQEKDLADIAKSFGGLLGSGM